MWEKNSATNESKLWFQFIKSVRTQQNPAKKLKEASANKKIGLC